MPLRQAIAAASGNGVVAALARRAKAAIYLAGLLPLAYTLYLGLTGQLGADPMRALEHTFGLWALRFLVAGLAITPLRRLGGPNLVAYRRAIGLLAFLYALLHVTVYVALDQGFDMSAVIADIIRRPYITVGMLAFVILIPLAITSSNRLMRRMGGTNWRRLHKLVYVAAAAAAIHFVMVVKSWSAEPLIYAGLVGVLLAFRLAHFARARMMFSKDAPRRIAASLRHPRPSERI